MDLYDPRVVPRYPGLILMSKIPVNLEALNTESLGRFMELESASDGHSSRPNDRSALASQYSSIGELYEDLITGVRGLPDERFTNGTDKQFVGNNFFGDQLFAVTDQATALRALRTIIEQGEGNLRVDDSHYDVFSQLYSKPISWKVYHVPDNPKTVNYDETSEKFIHKLSLAFDAAYCYLLQTIQRVWKTSEDGVRRVLFRNIHSIMSNVLTPLAEILVQQGRKKGVAAPCFNYYPMIREDGALISSVPLEPEELHKQLSTRIAEAAAAAAAPPPPPTAQYEFTLKRIKRYVEENIKPSV